MPPARLVAKGREVTCDVDPLLDWSTLGQKQLLFLYERVEDCTVVSHETVCKIKVDLAGSF